MKITIKFKEKMIDYDITKVKILPENHLVLGEFDKVVGIKKENQKLKGLITLIVISAFVLTIFKYYNHEDDTKIIKK